MKENEFMKESVNADLKDFATPAAAFSQSHYHLSFAYVERQNWMKRQVSYDCFVREQEDQAPTV